MRTKITIVYPFYNAPMMLKHQITHWTTYSKEVLDHLSIILVDDGSCHDKSVMGVVNRNPWFYPMKMDFRVANVLEDKVWNNHGARNLGAYLADDGSWLLMLDIKHTVSAMDIDWLQNQELNRKCFYTFPCKRMESDGNGGTVIEWMKDRTGNQIPLKPHPNTFLVTKEKFWETGGYDEDYCGTYGGDGPFMRWLRKVAEERSLNSFHIMRWSRDVIPDSCSPPEIRAEYKPLYRQRFEEKAGTRHLKPTNPLRFKWMRIV